MSQGPIVAATHFAKIINNAMQHASKLSQLKIGDPIATAITTNEAFPLSPETRDVDVRIESQIRIQTAFLRCFNHLAEIQQELYQIGIYEEQIPTEQQSL